MHMPIWLQILVAIAALAISAAAAWVSRQQFRVTKAKLQAVLFEPRLAIYDTVKEFLRQISQSTKIDEKDHTEFHRKLAHASFMARCYCNTDLGDYIEQLRLKWIKLEDHHRESSCLPKGKELTKHVSASAELLKWFHEQHDVFNQKFADIARVAT